MALNYEVQKDSPREDAYTVTEFEALQAAGLAETILTALPDGGAPLAGVITLEFDVADEDPDWWQAYGNCRGMDPAIFFPERGGDTLLAKDACRTCPVREPCLDYALKAVEKFGIWGGTSENERRTLRKALGITRDDTNIVEQNVVIDMKQVDKILGEHREKTRQKGKSYRAAQKAKEEDAA